MAEDRSSTGTGRTGSGTASSLPKVFVTSPAKQNGKLSVLREMFVAARERGEHVHWYGPGKKVCRNGTPKCPYHDEEDP